MTGHTIDLDTIQAIDYYRDNPLVQKAVKELAATMPEMEVLGADANQQEALFLIDDATYLHIQPCDSGWAVSYTHLDVYKRQLRMTPAQLIAMLSGGTVPGSFADDNNEQEENTYEESTIAPNTFRPLPDNGCGLSLIHIFPSESVG